jgi:hypothetical protein
VHEHRGHRGVHATRESAHDLARGSDLRPDALRGFLDERRNRPVAAAAADVEGEAAQDVLPVLGVHDLGMEEQPVERPLRRFHCDDGRGGAGGRDAEAARHPADVVAMARPHLELVGHALEEPWPNARRRHLHVGVAELPLA